MSPQIEQYLSVLNDEQKAAVVHEGSPLLILAGAGSGKTRVITTKIAYLISEKNVNPYSILSVTFTKKAANEMKERAIALDERAEKAQIKTFHSFGSWFLRKYAEYSGLEPSFTVYDDDDMALLVKKACPSLSTKESRIAAHQISLAKDYCLSPEDDLSIIGSEFDLNEIYTAYDNRLRATGNADFGDLIMLPVKVMERNPDIAAEIHSRFQVIMVDEYQDSNIAQYKLLQKLSGIEDGCKNYVCVVGDDDQSIYKFRGAEVQNILSFPEKFPGTEIIRLERNYRSTSKILEAAEVVVGKNENRLGKNLIADRGEGKKPILAFLGDQNEEAVYCSDLIRASLNKGAKYSDWAVLYRTNAQSLGFEKEFLHRKIPYVVVGSLKFYEREEIKDALSYLSLCVNPKDEISFRRVINKPVRGIGEKSQDKIMESAVIVTEDSEAADGHTTAYKNLIETAQNISGELSKKAREGVEEFARIFKTVLGCFDDSKKLSDFVQRVITDSDLEEYHKAGDEIEGTQRLLNLQELVNSAVPYACNVDGLLAFLDAINLDKTLDLENEDKDDNAVTLITLHNTKGLEYNRVIITGLEEGVFPRMDKVGADLEEERRLFYVGITRARDELYVTSTAKRCLYGNWQFMRPSPFIKEAKKAFSVKGAVPASFDGYLQPGFNGYSYSKGAAEKYSKGTKSGYFGKNADSFANKSNAGFVEKSNPLRWGDKAEVAAQWPKGTKVFHDDYGYGVVSKAYMNAGEYVAEITFENGVTKKFLPEYQRKNLQIIKD